MPIIMFRIAMAISIHKIAPKTLLCSFVSIHRYILYNDALFVVISTRNKIGVRPMYIIAKRQFGFIIIAFRNSPRMSMRQALVVPHPGQGMPYKSFEGHCINIPSGEKKWQVTHNNINR